MTIQCETTPTAVATGLTLHIVPKGTPSSTNPSNMTGDPFCSDGTYSQNTSECEAGEWKWGSFTVTLPDIIKPVTPLLQMTYMQDMTPEGCAASSVNDTKRLIDKRDSKYYWVAKLKDGNCWMTQNLELDLGAVDTLTPTDSNVSADWSFSSNGGNWYTSVENGSADSNAIQGWNLGEYVKNSPTDTKSCPTIYDDISGCDDQFTSIAGMAPMSIAINEGKSPDENISIQNGQYDAHFLVGNYYSWMAATAGTGLSFSGKGSASDSICPAGWQLPLATGTYNNTSGSFYYLLNEYGFVGSGTSDKNNVTVSPIYFVRAGDVSFENHFLGGTGYWGGYWSRVAEAPTYAFIVDFSPSYISPSLGVWPYDQGQTVRCIAK